MEELKKQVARAHMRLTFQRFLRVLAGSLFVTFLVAAIAIAVPKIWAMDVSETVWNRGWLGGAAGLSLLIAGVWAYLNRRSTLEAAIEIDQRFGLKERVSSTFALSEQDLATEAGQTLVQDASRRVAKIDVGDKFQIKGGWKSALPLVPAVLAFALIFLPNAKSEDQNVGASPLAVKKQIQNSTEDLKKKWAEAKRRAEEKDLEAAKLFSELEKGVDNLSKLENADKKQAMVKLNDLAKDIKKRRDEIGDAQKLQQQLNQLKDLKKGPGSEMAKAMSKGNFAKAAEELAKLKQQLKAGDLSKEDREKMAEQIEKMAEKMQQMADAHQQARDELKKQIEQAKKEGDRAKAGQLQRKLNALNQQNQQMQKMQQMANNMQNASQAMKQGDAQQAQQALEKMAGDLREMAENMEELQMLDEAMEQLANAKDQMNCKSCSGQGCKECQGMGQGDGQGEQPGQGMGEGKGSGDRPEDKLADGSFYDSQVRAKIRRGKSITTGTTNGENLAGDALEEVRNAIEAAESESADPLTNVRLPKEFREHVREYFDSVGGNQP